MKQSLSDRLVQFLVLGLMVFMLCATGKLHAQGKQIVREGFTFVQKTSGPSAIKTDYTFQCSNGEMYPIWLSRGGNAFVILTSKNSGKEYRKYLPEVTEQMWEANIPQLYGIKEKPKRVTDKKNRSGSDGN